MAEATDAFAALMAQARGGDAAALGELARQYEPELRVVARVLLGPALRPYLDSVDLVQSVHKSLLIGLRRNQFDISSPDKLIALALTVVRRKVARHWRRLRRQKRLDGGAETADDAGVLTSLRSALPDPAGAAQLQDAVHHLYRHLHGTDRRLIELRLEGHSTADVARELGLDADVLRVHLSRLRQRLRADGILTEWL
jgi:RNA polymerase sigma-70 factor (ECF subfamily)